VIAQSNASSPPGYSAMATGSPDWACARASVHPADSGAADADPAREVGPPVDAPVAIAVLFDHAVVMMPNK